jgi:hypothetical protein
MPPGLASNGCSQPKKARAKWAMPIHAPDKLRSHSKSQNHCAALLASPAGEKEEGLDWGRLAIQRKLSIC